MKENIFHPTDFDHIPSGSIYQMAMRFAHLANKKYHASQPTHVFCEVCNDISPVIFEPITSMSSTCGKYIGGDLLCGRCMLVIAVLYKRKLEVMEK